MLDVGEVGMAVVEVSMVAAETESGGEEESCPPSIARSGRDLLGGAAA